MPISHQQVRTGGRGGPGYLRCHPGDPRRGLTGNIDVYSPLPLNNAVRYIELEVTNTDGATPRTVIVEQYPLEYITNIRGWYSLPLRFRRYDLRADKRRAGR